MRLIPLFAARDALMQKFASPSPRETDGARSLRSCVRTRSMPMMLILIRSVLYGCAMNSHHASSFSLILFHIRTATYAYSFRLSSYLSSYCAHTNICTHICTYRSQTIRTVLSVRISRTLPRKPRSRAFDARRCTSSIGPRKISRQISSQSCASQPRTSQR